jgi:intracellular septation protein
MKFIFDLFPVILFFGTYKFFSRGNASNACLPDAAAHLPWVEQPILMATAVAIAASFVQISWLLLRKKKIDTMLWVSLAIISVFGGATLYFHDAAFIQWKPTILYWMFAVILAGTQLFTGRNLIRASLEEQIKLPNRIWKLLNVSWVLFFLALGFANIAAKNNLSCSDWVNFKVFGVTGLIMVFGMLQMMMLYKYIEEDKEQN